MRRLSQGAATAALALTACAMAFVPAARASAAAVPHKRHRPTDATSVPHRRRRPTDATSTHTRDWACIRWYESRGNYRVVGDQYGAYQFTLRTWHMLGYRGLPNLAPPREQDQAALRLWHWDLAHTGNPWSAWQTAPLCGL